jgi:signal transduction histidine kinase
LVTVGASAARIVGFAPVEGYPIPQAALGLQSVLWGYAVFSRGLLGQVPALSRVGEQTIFENVDDGLLVTARDGTIVRTNPRAATVFDRSSLVGTDVSTLFDGLGVDTTGTEPQQFRLEGRTYRMTVSEMTDWHDDVVGRAYIVSDISGLVRRRQRLKVLNRVLRHNVRNEVTVIRGSAEQLENGDDVSVTALGDRITSHADRLATLSDKARELQRVFDLDPVSDPVTVSEVVESVVASLDTQPTDAELRVDTEAVATRANERILALVVRESIENALEHGGPAPTVTVEAFATGDTVSVVVEDDGPGVPRTELLPIQSGSESALEHTSGLGLWLIHWGIQAVGGEVDIDSDANGTTVTLLVPAASDEIADATQSTRESHSAGSSISASVGK